MVVSQQVVTSVTQIDVWLHAAEIIVTVVLVPIAKNLVKVLLELREAILKLESQVGNLAGQMVDHEDRLRELERLRAGV